MALYTEPEDIGNAHRAEMLSQVERLIQRERRAADRNRKQYFRPDTSSVAAYGSSLDRYRTDLVNMMGWPLTLQVEDKPPAARMERVAADELGTIYRVWIETLPEVETYGLYFKPKGRGRFPLAISLHGGGGTPEYCSGFFYTANYNDMTRRMLRRGFAVFAPQFLIWEDDRFGPPVPRDTIDKSLEHLGGSLPALEIFRIRRSLDYLLTRREIDQHRVGMVGLSYGGFYTLYTAAVETRIKVAVPSCGVTNRKIFNWTDMMWTGTAQRILDEEAGALICPRALFIDHGTSDGIFPIRYTRSVAAKIRKRYEKLGIPEKFGFKEHARGHELDRDDDWLDFMERNV